jgi:hypothetical protein
MRLTNSSYESDNAATLRCQADNAAGGGGPPVWAVC